MPRLNLSTRPFYNEGLVHLCLAVAGAALLAGLVLSGRDVSRLTAARAGLNGRVSAAEQAITSAEASRRTLEAQARQSDLGAVRRSADEANSVIAARAFSWTALFNDVAAQLPASVRLVAVKPTRTDSGTKVAMIVRGRSNADIEQFLTRLEATRRFREGLVTDGELDDDGTLRVTLSISYTGPRPGEAMQPGPREGKRP